VPTRQICDVRKGELLSGGWKGAVRPVFRIFLISPKTTTFARLVFVVVDNKEINNKERRIHN